jgi:ribosomal protein RSM22 (predicted rRNA methylase)
LNNIPFANSEEVDIKTKLFKLNDNNKEEETEKDNKDGKKKLDENITIDIEEEKRLNKDKTNINPISINYTQAHAVAYLYSRAPYTYMTAKRVLGEIILRMPNFKPTSVLDYGAGLGSAIWAAHDSFGDELVKLAAIEPNKDMRKLGKFMTTGLKKDTWYWC